jgi:DNA invertase Pin-like site-specific DNA recombinase
MPSAIAYVRISENGRGENPAGLDTQRKQIEAFANDRGFIITKTFSEICSGRELKFDITNRPELALAPRYSAQHKCVMFIASLDRIYQGHFDVRKLFFARKRRIASAALGETDDLHWPVVDTVRKERAKNNISRGTKKGLAALKGRGVQLGNTTNLGLVRLKGSATNREKAKQRLSEFEISFEEAKNLGARTAGELAAKFNELGHLTARGGQWTAENIASFLRKLRGSKAAKSVLAKPIAPKPQPLADTNRHLTADGLERVRKARIAAGFKPGKTGTLMVALGFNRHDTLMPQDGRNPIKQEHLDALEVWIAKMEATA